MEELTEHAANKLFNDIVKASRENDSNKLSELMNTEATEEVAPTEEIPAEEPEVIESTDEEESPPEEADDTSSTEETPPEPSELDKLKEQLEKLNKENHSLKSQAGRVPHVQRRLKELDKKLEELTKQTTSPSSQPSTTIQPKVLKALEGIKETDPELADTIAKVIAEATDGVAENINTREIESVRAQRAEQYQAFQSEQANALLEMYPNAPEVFKSQTWKEWKAEQSGGIAALANSDTAEDVAFAFEKYARDMIAKYPEIAPSTTDKAPVAAVTPPNEAAQRIEAERLRKKQNAVNIGTPSAPGKVGMPENQQALFDKYVDMIRKQNSG